MWGFEVVQKAVLEVKVEMKIAQLRPGAISLLLNRFNRHLKEAQAGLYSGTFPISVHVNGPQ